MPYLSFQRSSPYLSFLASFHSTFYEIAKLSLTLEHAFFPLTSNITHAMQHLIAPQQSPSLNNF